MLLKSGYKFVRRLTTACLMTDTKIARDDEDNEEASRLLSDGHNHCCAGLYRFVLVQEINRQHLLQEESLPCSNVLEVVMEMRRRYDPPPPTKNKNVHKLWDWAKRATGSICERW